MVRVGCLRYDGHGKKSSSGKDAKKKKTDDDGRRRAALEEKDEEKDQEEIGVVVGAHGSGAHAMFEWLQSIPMGTARNKYKNSWIERMNKKGLTFRVRSPRRREERMRERMQGIYGTRIGFNGG